MVSNMALAEIFGRHVRARRVEMGWTQERLAFEANVKRSYISEMESGKRNPSLEVVERIALALGVKPGSLLDDA